MVIICGTNLVPMPTTARSSTLQFTRQHRHKNILNIFCSCLSFQVEILLGAVRHLNKNNLRSYLGTGTTRIVQMQQDTYLAASYEIK